MENFFAIVFGIIAWLFTPNVHATLECTTVSGDHVSAKVSAPDTPYALAAEVNRLRGELGCKSGG